MVEKREDWRVEAVHGRLDAACAEEIVRFWTSAGVLGEHAARERLPEVVCVVRDASGAVVGTNAVAPADVPLIGGLRFWMYRALVPPEAADAMVRAAFDALEAAFEPGGDGPVGLCLLVDDPGERRRRPQAEWSGPRLLYAGYLPGGRQVRIAYFDGARIGG